MLKMIQNVGEYILNWLPMSIEILKYLEKILFFATQFFGLCLERVGKGGKTKTSSKICTSLILKRIRESTLSPFIIQSKCRKLNWHNKKIKLIENHTRETKCCPKKKIVSYAMSIKDNISTLAWTWTDKKSVLKYRYLTDRTAQKGEIIQHKQQHQPKERAFRAAARQADKPVPLIAFINDAVSWIKKIPSVYVCVGDCLHVAQIVSMR